MFRKQYVIYASILIAIVIEVFPYLLLPYTWNDADCTACLKFLVVADPQILGRHESNFFARWDCDRFLSRTFHQALAFTNPDFILFLGDLMDEGHQSSDDEFNADLYRFRQIFYDGVRRLNTAVIIVPGDNDIGGEEDPVRIPILRRFESTFYQKNKSKYSKEVAFYKINAMTNTFETPLKTDKVATRIGISHVSVFSRIFPIATRVVQNIQPSLIFSGHNHVSKLITSQRDNVWVRKISFIGQNSKITRIQLNDDVVHEIMVPTCSYRMGTPDIGYGFAKLDTSSKLVYHTVLWLPSRLTHLYLYCALLIIIFLVFFIDSLKKYCRIFRRKNKLFIEA